MREIKFRAWNKDNNCFFTENHVKVHLFGFLSKGEYPVMQYTGLKDKNGKEIYEGDVVTYYRESSKKGVISWSIESVCFMIGEDEIGYNINNLQVIGNIYENSELLEGK